MKCHPAKTLAPTNTAPAPMRANIGPRRFGTRVSIAAPLATCCEIRSIRGFREK
ncbi:hypothetical protein GCM10008020_26450 [Massilia psychrophila]|nr:hypothetical protein GCM10008020_26450 [Massilia psychrophila]